jgi:hypothetical protein
MKTPLKLSWAILIVLIVTYIISCKKDKGEPDFIASYTYSVDAVDFKKVSFQNISVKFEKLSWDFGDTTALSSEVNPVHIYERVGVYAVKLTATSPGGLTNVYSQKVVISDPNAELTKLVGENTKTWKLLRNGVKGNSPLQVGPFDRSSIWWFVDATELPKRPCMLNDEWTFGRDGSMIYNAHGDFWAEYPIFDPSNVCQDTSNMFGVGGKDLSAWGGGNHQFRLVNGSYPTITAVGKGAFIGFFKSATDYEVTKLNPMVQDSVRYNVVKLYDGAVDTLIIEANYKFEIGDANPGGYWRYVLVHYDNPADEPPMP